MSNPAETDEGCRYHDKLEPFAPENDAAELGAEGRVFGLTFAPGG